MSRGGGPRRDDDFFVGYLPVPEGLARFLRRAVVALALLAIAVAAILAAGQRPLGSGEFEFGVERELEGVLRAEPLPALWISAAASDGGPTLEVVPLVGQGKHGPSAAVLALAGQEVRLVGSWIRRGSAVCSRSRARRPSRRPVAARARRRRRTSSIGRRSRGRSSIRSATSA